MTPHCRILSGTLITMAIFRTSMATTSITDVKRTNEIERFMCLSRAEMLQIIDWPSFALLIAFMVLNTCLIRDQPSLLLHRQFKLIRTESVSYRLNSRSCQNLRTCFSNLPIKTPLVRPFLQHTNTNSLHVLPPLTTWLYHTRNSGNFHRSFNAFSASRWPNSRGGGWSQNQEFTRSGILMDLSHYHNDVASAVWGWKNAKWKTNELQCVESLCFAWKPAGIFPLTSFYSLQPQSA